MLVLDITNNNIEHEFGIDKVITLKFCNNYDNNHFLNNPIINKNLNKGETIDISVKICKYLGEGSYGKVFKIKINSTYYALKINENEESDKLRDRYMSLKNINTLEKYIINIYLTGKINSNKYSYFSIMEYGGKTLKSILPIKSLPLLVNILKQLFNIVSMLVKYKILMTDFKLSNITVSSDNRIKLIDLYMWCDSYTPCKKCKIVKTYSTIEIEKERGIYEDPEYNYTCVYIPLAICLIDLLCEHSASQYCIKLGNNFGMALGIKDMIPLLQIACYNYSNDSNRSIKDYKNIHAYKKKIEAKYPDIKKPEFYEYFMNMMHPRNEYKEFISHKKISLILNDLFNCHPEQRSLIFLKDKLK